MGVGFTAKTQKNNLINTQNSTNSSHNNSSSSNSESWGMGFLFIFFPEEDDNKRKNNFSFSNSSTSSSESPSTCKSINAILKRTNSSHLLSKAQSTISVCALLIFITLLLFTLSTFEPTKNPISSSRIRKMQQKRPNNPAQQLITFPHALQGMGSLYRRGTRAMNNIVVAHVAESVTQHELRMFLRLLHRSGITSKSDVLFIFSSTSLLSFDHNVVVEENASFSKLVHGYGYNNNEMKMNYTSSSSSSSSTFDASQFVVSSRKEKESGEPIWGRKIKENGNNESTRLSYGSVVSFDADELDPESALSGFFPEHVPMNLRRWACYPMLLGRIRRNYKRVMLVDVKEHYVLGDSLSQLKNCSLESVIITTLPTRKRNSEKKIVNSGFVLGGARGIRRLANAMLTEIVRVVTQHKKRNMVSEPALFNQLVANEFILKNVNLIVSGESTRELSSLTGLMNSNSKSGSSSFSISKFPIVRRGNSNLDISYVFKKYLCSSPLDSIAYSDC